jgi:hypothetical protein
VLLDRLGGDPVGEGADLGLVVAEEVGVVGRSQVGGQFADLDVDGLADGLGEVVDLGLFLGRHGCASHGRTPVPSSGFPQRSPISPFCTRIPPTFKMPTVRDDPGDPGGATFFCLTARRELFY